jgi:hypothetical protein
LDLPVVFTEQYPKAFKHTVPELLPFTEGVPVFEKKQFSMLTPEVEEHLKGLGLNMGDSEVEAVEDESHVVLFGIEAHVCVKQTTLDLLERGVNVHLVGDAVSSQRPLDRSLAMFALTGAGAAITSVESLMFELVQSADHPKFKDISKRVIEHNKAYTSPEGHWAKLASDGLATRV